MKKKKDQTAAKNKKNCAEISLNMCCCFFNWKDRKDFQGQKSKLALLNL